MNVNFKWRVILTDIFTLLVDTIGESGHLAGSIALSPNSSSKLSTQSSGGSVGTTSDVGAGVEATGASARAPGKMKASRVREAVAIVSKRERNISIVVDCDVGRLTYVHLDT